MKDLEVLTTLKTLSDQIIQYYIANNDFEGVKTKYQQLEENKKHFGSSLFLIPDHILNKLDLSSSMSEHDKTRYRNEIKLINLAVFSYTLFYKRTKDYEMCMNNFFLSITTKDESLSTEDINFYLQLRHLCLVEQLEKNDDIDLLSKIYEYFPVDVEKLHSSNMTDYTVVSYLSNYREQLNDQNKQEIIYSSSFYHEQGKALQDYVRGEYEHMISLPTYISSKQTFAEPSSSKKTVIPEITTELSTLDKSIGQKIIRSRDPNERRIEPEEINMPSNDDSSDEFSDARTDLSSDDEYSEARTQPPEEAFFEKPDSFLRKEDETESLQEDETESLQEEETEPSLPEEETEPSLQEEETEPSFQEEETETSYQGEETEPSLQEKETEPALQEEEVSETVSRTGEVDNTEGDDELMEDYNGPDKPDDDNDEDIVEETEPSNAPRKGITGNKRKLPIAFPPKPVVAMRKIRKKANPWTDEEVKKIAEGLQKFRRPYWRDIREWAGPALGDRTAVDIKDKVRNIIKAYQRAGITDPEQMGSFGYYLTPDASPKYNLVKR